MKHVRSPLQLLHLCIATALLFSSPAVLSGTKVAFTGDQGTGEDARAVLAMIASEGTDLLMLQGDLGYDPNAAGRWEANLTEALGENFPVLTVAGNHENYEWALYQNLIQRRVNRADGLNCSGNVGVKAHCEFGNIEIVQVSPGIREIEGVLSEDNYAQYISDKFSGSSDKWRICSWHKNQAALQTGSKNNSTGWDVYRSCLNVGAMVAVAHEHAYSRTHLMSNFENQTVAHYNSDMTLEPGKSFMFVSGLGGRSIREQSRYGDWWGSVYTASQGATHGALFCDFEQNTAECYFKAINGAVPDRFTLRLNGNGASNAIASNNDDQQNTNNDQPSNEQQTQVSALEAGDLPAVFQRSDSDELRWIDWDANGQLGSVWIDRTCAESLGGVDLTGDWDDLISLAPSTDAVSNPCGSNNSNNDSSNSNQPSLAAGYVFLRTDKTEYRWIDKNDNGQVASVRINEECANNLGGVQSRGDWFALLSAAPAFDELPNPCTGIAAASSSENVSTTTKPSSGSVSSGSGYVFSRTDKDEMRWVAKSASGELGSVRINKVCASNLGGATVSGDWSNLLDQAPKLDALANPCGDDDEPDSSLSVAQQDSQQQQDSESQQRSQPAGYIFERTDVQELRWITRNDYGDVGSVRINEQCAQQLGLPRVRGDWLRLSDVAPAFDSLRNPCS